MMLDWVTCTFFNGWVVEVTVSLSVFIVPCTLRMECAGRWSGIGVRLEVLYDHLQSP